MTLKFYQISSSSDLEFTRESNSDNIEFTRESTTEGFYFEVLAASIVPANNKFTYTFPFNLA